MLIASVYHIPSLTSEKSTLVSSETRLNARTIIVTNSALVTILFGANKPSPTPFTILR